MAGRGRKRQRGGGAPKHGRKATRTDFERKEIEQLTERIASGAPPPGSVDEQPNVDDGSYAGAKRFDELPLSQYTQQALAEHSFTELTAIQRAALPHALCGRDVLGAAKTGSGKTLCFLIPVRSLVTAHTCACVRECAGPMHARANAGTCTNAQCSRTCTRIDASSKLSCTRPWAHAAVGQAPAHATGRAAAPPCTRAPCSCRQHAARTCICDPAHCLIWRWSPQAVERLFRAQWTQLDGLGALVLAPTRELALQIFSDLRKVGARHSLSAGLLIGGKDVATEQSHIARARHAPPACSGSVVGARYRNRPGSAELLRRCWPQLAEAHGSGRASIAARRVADGCAWPCLALPPHGR